jgi:hypothetical protein
MLDRVRAAASHRLLFLPHAIRQMSRPERMLPPGDVAAVVMTGEIIEDYPEDVRGHSCLMLGFDAGGNPLHVVCAPKVDYLAVITAYRPDPTQWSPDWRTRQ